MFDANKEAQKVYRKLKEQNEPMVLTAFDVMLRPVVQGKELNLELARVCFLACMPHLPQYMINDERKVEAICIEVIKLMMMDDYGQVH